MSKINTRRLASLTGAELDQRRAHCPGSSSATIVGVPVIPQKELRNNVADVLRRAEAGEEFTITVAGRPVAHLGPARR